MISRPTLYIQLKISIEDKIRQQAKYSLFRLDFVKNIQDSIPFRN
jgi:DNA-dependent RNA polymerase auxiliary subunit epsilon